MRVFLSYARADRVFASKLGRELGKAGHEIWTEREILPGDNWAKEIDSALRRADAIVAIVSPEALSSEFVSREWQFALGQEKFQNRLIPVVVKPTEDMPWIFDRLQAVRTSSPQRAASELAERLRSL